MSHFLRVLCWTILSDLIQRLVDMLLFSCLVFKALEIESSKEFNLVENIKNMLIPKLTQNM